MTMDASETQVEYIALEVFMHDKPVTYHTLSRALSIHVNVAKQVLSEFYAKNNAKLVASWIITGIKNDKLTIQLVSNDDLPETVKLFLKIHTVHIYCVYLNKLNLSKYDLALHELNYPLKLSDLETYYKNGMIKGPKVTLVEQPLQQSTPYRSPKKVTSAAASTAEKPARQIKSSGLTSGYVSRKNQKKQEPVIPTKRSTPTTGYVYKSRKVQDNQPKERVIISHSDDEVMEDVDSQKKSNTTDLEKLFESDFSDDEKDDKPAKQETPGDVEMVDVEESIQDSLPEEPVSLPESLPDPIEEPEETVQTVDEDGYITTARKKTTAKPEPRKATKPRPTLTPANKKDGKKKQASLMSFFGQK